MKRIVLCLAAALSFTAGTADREQWSTFGTLNCGRWTTLKDNTLGHIWLAGFLTGLNAAQQDEGGSNIDVLKEIDSMEQANVWMDNWCRTHPLDNVAFGGRVLFGVLKTKAQKR